MRLWVRADASPSMGFGHVMRMVALAERARDREIEPRFIIGGGETAIRTVTQRGFVGSLATSPENSDWLRHVAAEDLIFFDGYQFGPDIMRLARDRAARVGAVDDLGFGRFPVDVLVNQNLPDETHYSLPVQSSLLVGPRYALVRREFMTHRRDRIADRPRTLLVTMGGSDVAGVTERIVQLAPIQATFQRMLVVVGPGLELPAAVEEIPCVEIVQSPADVAGTFARADAALSAAGSTTWELLAMGIPIALVQVAENQRDVGPALGREGAALFVGGPDDLESHFAEVVRQLADPLVRLRLGSRALQVVDGRGADRCLQALLGSSC